MWLLCMLGVPSYTWLVMKNWHIPSLNVWVTYWVLLYISATPKWQQLGAYHAIFPLLSRGVIPSPLNPHLNFFLFLKCGVMVQPYLNLWNKHIENYIQNYWLFKMIILLPNILRLSFYFLVSFLYNPVIWYRNIK